MPEQQPYVTMQKGGKVYDFPGDKATLLKAKSLGWIEVPAKKNTVSTPEGAIDENSFLENMRASMGLPPKGGLKSDIQDLLAGGKQLATHPIESAKLLGGSMLEAQEATGERGLKELQSPDYLTKAHGVLREIYAGLPVIGPIMERAGTQFEKGQFKGGLGTMTPLLVGEALKSPVVQRGALQAVDVAGEKAGGAVRSTVRSIADRDPAAVRQAAREAASEQEQYQFNANQARVNARAAYEAGETQKAKAYEEAARKWEDAASQRVAKARGEHEAEVKQKTAETQKLAKQYAQDLAEKRKVEAENARIEAAEKNLTETAQASTKDLSQNIRGTLDTVKTSFDAEYGDFDAKILGKSPANPKGTLQAQLSPFADAVKNAQENIIEGTPESIKQFSSILEQATKDYIDLGGGKLQVAPGQTISAADLRGYVTELEGRLYDGNLLPDVKAAVKSVVKSGKEQLTSAIEDVHGKSAVDAYHDLNSRYSDYLTDWRDTSSTNPLPKVRRILLEGVVQNNPNYPVHLDIGRILKGANAQKALALLDKYKQFGAQPEVLSNYVKTLEKLDSLEKLKKVPEVSRPKYPAQPREAAINIPKPPERPEETTEAAVNFPKPPKAFNAEEFIKEGVARRMRTMGHWGTGMAVVSFFLDLLHGNAGAMLTAGERVAAVQFLKQYMTSDKFLDWVAKEPGKKGPMPSFPKGEGEPPAPKGGERGGPKSGISPMGTEKATRPNTFADLSQALHIEQQELMQRVRNAPPGPERDQAVQRLKENELMIRQFETEGGVE